MCETIQYWGRSNAMILRSQTMGWSFRRSVNFGPLRINLSKSGVGYSVGTRGFRVGQDSRAGDTRRSRSPKQASIAGTTNRRGLLPLLLASSPIAPVNPAGAQQGSRATWPIYIVAAVLLYGLIRLIFAVL